MPGQFDENLGQIFTIAPIVMKQLWKISPHSLQMVHRLPVSLCKVTPIIVCQKFYKKESWKDGYTAPKSFKDLVKKCRFFSSSVLMHIHWMLSLLSFKKHSSENQAFLGTLGTSKTWKSHEGDDEKAMNVQCFST